MGEITLVYFVEEMKMMNDKERAEPSNDPTVCQTKIERKFCRRSWIKEAF